MIARWKYLLSFSVLLLLFITTTPQPAEATTFTDSRVHEVQIATGLNNPTAIKLAPDGRVFILLQSGDVRIYKEGQLLPTPFLSLNVDSSGERGLLGITFDPDFVNNNYLYLYYTPTGSTKSNRLSRFTANGDVVATNSEVIIKEFDTLYSATNHNGGTIDFGPDGKIYVAIGDGGSGHSNNGQDTSNRFGTMIRLNKDGSIPTDNPFYNTLTGENRSIWAYGLRNPYTFAFQPGTGRMYINDVGGGSWEEINEGVAGANYGWDDSEGPTTNPNFTSPIYAYDHSGGICAITGGAFYNPAWTMFPDDLVGDYLFLDYCADWIKRYDLAQPPSNNNAPNFATNIPGSTVDIEVSFDGTIYYISRQADALYRLFYIEDNVIANGDFSGGENNFFFIGNMNRSVNNGVLNVTSTDPNASALIAQPLPYPATPKLPIESTVQLGNTSNRPKNVTVRLFDVAGIGGESLTCFFTVPANSALQTYTLKGATLTEWTQIDFNLFLDDFDEASLLVDNINVKYNKNLSINPGNVQCDPPELPQNKNLVANGDFNNGPQFYFFIGSLAPIVPNGILYATRFDSNADAFIAQPLRYGASTGNPFEVKVDLGNETPQPKNVRLELAELGGNGVIQCDFTVPAYTPLMTFSMRGKATGNWNGMDLKLHLLDNNAPNLLVDNFSVEYKPGINPTTTECTNPWIPNANQNFVQNGDFSNGENGYFFLGNITRNVTNGILNATRSDYNGIALVAQPMPVAIQNNSNIQATVQLGNTSNKPKNVTLRLFDVVGKVDSLTCLFTVPANTPLQTYTLRGKNAWNWIVVDLNLFVDDFNEGGLQVDNFDVRYVPNETINGLECNAPAKPSNKNLVVNGDFAGGGWFYFALGDLIAFPENGLFRMTRTNPNGIGLLAQPVRFGASNGDAFSVSLKLANVSLDTKIVKVRLFDVVGGVNKIECEFRVPAQSTLNTYTMLGKTNANWQTIDFNIFVEDNNQPWLEIDDIDVRYDSSANPTSTQCTEPNFNFFSEAGEMLYLVNQRRCEIGEVALVLNLQLNAAAVRHSNDMAFNMNTYISHIGTDGSSAGQRITQAGYNWNTYGENIAAGNSTALATFDQWWTSTTGHKENILKSSFREMGLARTSQSGTRYTNYWTQVFGNRSGAPTGTCPTPNLGIFSSAGVSAAGGENTLGEPVWFEGFRDDLTFDVIDASRSQPDAVQSQSVDGGRTEDISGLTNTDIEPIIIEDSLPDESGVVVDAPEETSTNDTRSSE